MKKSTLLLSALFLITAFCSALTKEEFQKLPYKQTSWYGGTFSSELLEKIRTFEGNPSEFLKELDNYDGYQNHKLTEEEKKLFLEYFSYLPQKLQQAVTENVYAIYFVDGMWYGALTDIIFDENGKAWCTMFLNPDTFHYSLDDWLTYRDNSVFKNVDKKNKMEVKTGDTHTAFLHLFLHESVHVYDYINHITPYYNEAMKTQSADNLFYSVWQNMNEPLKKYQNKKFEKAAFYEYGTKIPIKNGKEIIDYLAKTPFCTLYAATNWMDDFAEAVTFYYLQKRFGNNYELTYIKDEKVNAVYSYRGNQNVKIYDSLCKEICGF